jgi:hypothetical protein
MIKSTTVGMQWQLRIGAILVFLAGIPLFLAPDHTDIYFAWTIKPPLLTAAFLGAAYWGAYFLGWLAARQPIWARARLAVAGPLLFTVLTLVVTLLHLDRFHLAGASPMAVFFTWVWMAVYIGVPVSMTFMLVRQWRAPGGDPRRVAALPVGLRLADGLGAAGALGFGLALFVAPAAAASAWAWSLTPLTAQAIAAWLLAIGVICAEVAWENDVACVKPVAISFTAISLLQLVAVARYPGDLAWGDARGWLYLAVLISLALVSLASWAVARPGNPA